MTDKIIPFYKPFLPPWEVVSNDIQTVYTSGMLAPGVFTNRLERKFEELLGVKHAIAFSNASDAMMCLVAWIKSTTKKNTVIIPNFTFAATWQAVDWNEMNTIVVDCDSEGLIDEALLEKAVVENKDTLACVFPVHISGNPAHVDFVKRLCDKHGIYAIYDAAHGLGTVVENSFLGNNGLAEVFSIGTTKPIAAGEGGVITTNNDELAAAMWMASMHGHKLGELDVEIKSLNGRIQEINSIIAYYGIGLLDENMKHRAKLSSLYKSYLPIVESGPGVTITARPQVFSRSGVSPSYKDFTVFLEVQDVNLSVIDPFPYRERIVSILSDRGIGTKRYYYPDICNLTCVKNDTRVDSTSYINGSGARLSRGCISLPFYTNLSLEDAEHVMQEFKRAILEVLD